MLFVLHSVFENHMIWERPIRLDPIIADEPDASERTRRVFGTQPAQMNVQD